MSHGIRIITLLRENMRALGRKPSDIENAAVIDQYLDVNGLKMKRVRKASAVKPRARDAIFDLLAKCDGQNGTLTRHTGARIAGAKKQILDALTDDGKIEVTTEQVVAEIEKRWARFCRKFTEKRMQTAMALVSHWGEFSDADAVDRRRTRAEQTDVYVEPAGDWRERMAGVCGIDIAALRDRLWLDIGVEYRAATLKDIIKRPFSR